MWTNPAAPTVSSHKGSPNSVIRLRQVNEHRRLRQSLNVSVAFVSTLMNNYEGREQSDGDVCSEWDVFLCLNNY